MKKIFILLGHPDTETLSGAFADIYEKAAKEAGHEVRRANIGQLSFDPILHKGYKTIQALEPDLKKLQEDITWSEHFVLIYPIWWSSAPALLKGLIDRMWLPAFAFRFRRTKDGKRLTGWDKLLAGRSARVIGLTKNYAIVEHFMYGDYMADIVSAVLRFSGFKTRVSEVGNSEGLSDAARASWEKKIAELARAAK